MNWNASVTDGTKHLDGSVIAIATGIGMVIATRATGTGTAIAAVTTEIGAVIENISMTAHLTSTVIAPTVTAPVLGTTSMTGSAHDPHLSHRVPHRRRRRRHPLLLPQFLQFPSRPQFHLLQGSLPRRTSRT